MYSTVFVMCQLSTNCMDANRFVNINLNRLMVIFIIHDQNWVGILIENQEKSKTKGLNYTTYIRSSVPIIPEKVTCRKNCTVIVAKSPRICRSDLYFNPSPWIIFMTCAGHHLFLNLKIYTLYHLQFTYFTWCNVQ